MKKVVAYGALALVAIFLVSIVFKFVNMQRVKSNARDIYSSHSKILGIASNAVEIEKCSRSQQGPFDNGRKDCYIHFAMPLRLSSGIASLKSELSKEGWRSSGSSSSKFRKFFGNSMCIVEVGPLSPTEVFFEQNNIAISVGSYHYHLYCSWSDVLAIS